MAQYQSLYYLATILCLFSILCLFPVVCGQGKVPPLMPTEYVSNVVQRKWNFNGFGVNNTYNMIMYVSRSQLKWRTDTVVYGSCSNNRSISAPLQASQAISLLDFTKNPTLNTYMTTYSLAAPQVCATGPAGFPPPPPANFLSLVHAIYAGQFFLPEYSAKCDRWVIPTKGASASFYFISSSQQFVRWDFQSYDEVGGQHEVGVVTNYFNLLETNITSSIFAGSGKCPSWTVPPYDTCANATAKMDMDDFSLPVFIPFHKLIPLDNNY